MSCRKLIINLEPTISCQLAIVERATYSIQFNLVGSGMVTGFGNYQTIFKGYLDQRGLPINNTAILKGSGQYQSIGCPSISTLKGTLQIVVAYPPQDPLPTKPSIETIWNGVVTITGGNVTGILNRIDGDLVSPNLYNLKANYNQTCTNGVSELIVKDLVIYPNY